MKILFILTLCFVSLYAIDLEALFEDEWETFKITYGKNYTGLEDMFRKKVFLENWQKISQHNHRAANGLKSYHLGMNKYGDLLHHEFVKLMNGYKSNSSQSSSKASHYLSPSNINLPKSVDWRDYGYVTEVKDQGHCGSCWAFSTTGSLEGQHFKKTKRLVSLSEQNLIDCSKKEGNEGCQGGVMDNAFTYIQKNGGLDTEESYPYKGKVQKCHFDRRNIGATETGFVDLPSGDEEKLEEAVATVGPISIAIDASHQSFQFYSGGIYDEEECSSSEVDHAVLLVGYGENSEGTKYWIIKNSWGTSWGEDGYMRIEKNKNNLCGVALSPSYPLV